MRVAVTGAAGYVGQVFLSRLLSHPEVEHVLALDVRPLSVTSDRVSDGLTVFPWRSLCRARLESL